MRLLLTLLCLAPLPAFAAIAPTCPYNVIPYLANVLTPEQLQAMHAGHFNGDPVVAEAILRTKAASLEPLRTGSKTVRISWKKAKALVLLGAIRATVQSRERPVELITPAGTVYEAIPPNDHALTALLDSVDPCYLFISREIAG